MIENGMLPSSFINSLGYHLNCYDRQIACAIENLAPNSMFYLLLFRDAEKNFEGEKIFSLIDNIGIHVRKVEEKICTFDEFNERNKNFLLNQKNIIMRTDLFYDKRYYNYGYIHFYKKKHHSHYILLKGYDEIRKEYIVIDENPKYIYNTKRSINWPYEVVNIDAHYLFEIAIGNRNTGSMYEYTELVVKNNIGKLSIREIFRFYYYKLLHINTAKLQKIVKESIERYVLGDDFTFSFGKQPKTLENIKLRNEQINILYRCYLFLFAANDDKIAEIKYNFSEICVIYKRIYMLLTKYAITKNESILVDVSQQLNRAFELEEILHVFQIELLRESID